MAKALTITRNSYINNYYYKRKELLEKLEVLSNVRGKKVLLNVREEKVSIAKSVKNEYIRCISALNALEQEFKREKNNIRYRRKVLEDIKKDLFKLGLAMGCTLAINAAAKDKNKETYKYNNLTTYEYSSEISVDKSYTPTKEVEPIVMENITEVSILETEHQIMVSAYETYLPMYANYYHFDSQKVLELAKELTDDFNIDLLEVVGETCVTTDNYETKSMIFINNLNRNKLSVPLKKLGYKKQDFICDPSVEKISDDLILSNGLTYNQYMEFVAEKMNLDKNYALAISLYETGGITNDQSRSKNNFGGLGGANAKTYPTPEAGVIAFCCNLKEYERYGLTNLRDLSSIYVHGRRGNPSELWVNNVCWFHDEIEQNPEKYFSNNIDEEYTYKLEK